MNKFIIDNKFKTIIFIKDTILNHKSHPNKNRIKQMKMKSSMRNNRI